MAFRTIVIESRCKLDYSLNYMVCRKLNEETKVLLSEIKIIIINTTQVAITAHLISECIKNKIKIIFSDEKHNPLGEIVPYYNNYYSYRKIKEQLSFSDEIKNELWKMIIKRKIINQAENLKKMNKVDASKLLYSYASDVISGDLSNREGHSAKVYFNELFGKNFNRDLEIPINKYLNYGYSIILSTINREIKAMGYLTELGIHHIGESNPFNLSYDLIEPLRPFVDSYVILNKVNDDNFRNKFIEMLSTEVIYNDKSFILSNAIHLYVEDMFSFLKTKEIDKVRFIEYEL